MMSNITLFVTSLIFISIIFIYFQKKWPGLDLIDLYIIFVAAHFGIYPFIRSLFIGKGVIHDISLLNPFVISLVFIHVLIILVLIKVIFSFFPQHIIRFSKLKFLIEQLKNINRYVLLSIFSFLIFFQIYVYYKYGIKSYILPNDFEKIGKDLPYWLTSVRTIYNYLAFALFLGMVAKALAAEKPICYFWLVLILLLIPLGAYYGRRFSINMIITGIVIWLANREEDIFKLKYLSVVGVLLVSFFAVSNIYQSYRDNLLQVGTRLNKLSNPVSAALNFGATLENLKIRPGTWEFDYLVLDKQIESSEKITKGRIYWEGFKSSIPRLVWPGKNFLMIDEIMAELYSVKPKDIDIGKNNFGLMQLEFGFLSIILVPMLINLIILATAGLTKITLTYPTFLWLLSGNTINYLINIEENGNEIFFMIRNILAILILLTACIFIKRTLSYK